MNDGGRSSIQSPILSNLPPARSTLSPPFTASTDEGKTIKVKVSFTDDEGGEETLTSAATVAVTASPNHPAIGWLKLLGMAEVGQSLRVIGLSSGYGLTIDDANGLTNATFNYQWIRNDGTTDVDIPNATGESYTLTDDDEGKTIKVRMSFIDDAGNEETLTSTETTAVTARPSSSELSAPTSLSVSWSQGEEKGIELNWTAPEGTITGYQILRLETPTRSRWWEPYPYGCTPLTEVHVSDTGSDATTYTDTDVREGASYTYSVRAINSDGVGWKAYRSFNLQWWPSGVPGTLYRAPTNLVSSQIKNGVGLTWNAPEGEVTGYQILRRSPEQCDYGYRVYVENTNSTDTHWADRDVVAGTRYQYHVRAMNDVGAGRLDTRTLFRPTAAELVVPAEVKVMAWKKGSRNGVVVRGAGGPGGGSQVGGGTVRIGGRVPWGAEVEYAYRAGYDSRGRVSVTHVVDQRGYAVMLTAPEGV